MQLLLKMLLGTWPPQCLRVCLGGYSIRVIRCAVAFATILAVVAGLVFSGASAIAHDIYGEIIKKGKVTEKQQVGSKISLQLLSLFSLSF